jgi:TetR/AcrR family transcriptional repressor of lmrAB and yxaGH operons
VGFDVSKVAMIVKGKTRRKILRAGAMLFARHGYTGTRMHDLLEASATPKGSFYFHFPGGKEQLAREVIGFATTYFSCRWLTRAEKAADPADALILVAETIARDMVRTDFTSGSLISSIALGSSPDAAALTGACAEAYRAWLTAINQVATEFGDDQCHPDTAMLILCVLEGATVVSRVLRDPSPLLRTSRLLASYLRAAKATGDGRRAPVAKQGA